VAVGVYLYRLPQCYQGHTSGSGQDFPGISTLDFIKIETLIEAISPRLLAMLEAATGDFGHANHTEEQSGTYKETKTWM
jgi:hypothetical protein